MALEEEAHLKRQRNVVEIKIDNFIDTSLRPTMFEAYYIFLGYLCSQLPWTLIFLITQMWGIRLYYINDYNICTRIQKRVNGLCTHKMNNDKNYGYSIGYWYILNITQPDSETYSVWIIATQDSYNKLTLNMDEIIPFKNILTIPKESLTIYERAGNYSNCWFKKRLIKINSIQPRKNQEVIIDKIKEHHAENNHTVVYLHGPPGTGKSIIGVLLANAYKSVFCNTLKLWQPGDSLNTLYSEVEPTATCPLIIVFDEFDGPLTQMHNGISPHPKFLIQTRDKTGWNQLLDEIHIGIFPHVILLLTSNKDPSYICEMDPSYIREGRVDLIFKLEMPEST